MKVPDVLTFDFMSKPSPGERGLREGVQNGQEHPGLPAASFLFSIMWWITALTLREETQDHERRDAVLSAPSQSRIGGFT